MLRARYAVPMIAAMLLAGSAGAQEKPETERKDAPEAPVVALKVKAGDTMRFRRTRERTATCEALGRDGDDRVVQEFTVKVESATDGGGVVLSVDFGHVTGHIKLDDGTRLELDTATGLPEVTEPVDLVNTRGLTFLGGAKLRVTLDARGSPIAETGVREAMRKAFAGTALEALVEEYPDADALGELWPYFPPLPPAKVADGGTWKDEATLDFGARSAFSYQREWTLAVAGTDVKITAACEHVPGATVPEGQKNEGSGKVACVRSLEDGFVRKQTVEATFRGRGNFDIDTKLVEILERLPEK